MKKFFQLIISILICQLAGIIGSFFTVSSVGTWYTTVDKPIFNPPGWVFGPVWITLYTLMGIALYLVWQKGYNKQKIKQAVWLFLIHLVVNSLWSIIFFGWQQIWLAFVWIILLWILIVWCMWWFYKIDKRAFYLLVPYLLWVSFASILNFSLGLLN